MCCKNFHGKTISNVAPGWRSVYRSRTDINNNIYFPFQYVVFRFLNQANCETTKQHNDMRVNGSRQTDHNALELRAEKPPRKLYLPR